ACVLPENPASYRVVRTKSYLFNKAISPTKKRFTPSPCPGILPYLHHTFFVSGSFFDTIFATCSLALTVNVFLNLPPSSFVREK
ncbi:hypothetical protein P2O75_23480, partial [Escherichia coli]